MKFKKTHVIINPSAGKGESIISCLNKAFDDRDNHLQVHVAGKKNDVFSIASSLSAKDELVAICGGDGSISDGARALYGSNVTMAIIPGGTANVISKDLLIPQDTENAIDLLMNGLSKTIHMDMGLVNGTPFLLRVNLGIMADMVIAADPKMKDSFGQLAYGITAVQSIWKSDPLPYKMIIDGKEINETGVSLTITNAGNIGIGDFSFLPGIEVTDGFLDVILLNNSDFMSLMRVTGTTLFQTDSELLKHWKCKEISIYFEKPVKYICDDTEKEADMLHIKVVPGALRILVPNTNS
jgi:YegS/Rv2252/BmrU family lipid kinase